jgi:hypothetical protein
VRALRLTNKLRVVLLCAGLMCVFGPHLLVLGYKAAGIQPPAALVFFCLLHHGGDAGQSPRVATFTLRTANGQLLRASPPAVGLGSQ